MSPLAGASPVHPIEAESYRRLYARVELSHLPPLTRAVIARVIHATADFSFAETMVVDEQGAARARSALSRGATVVTDVEMVRAGVNGSVCYLDTARRQEDFLDAGLTLSARAMRLAARAHPTEAIFAIGCAPTALDELVDLAERGEVEPVLVIGVPVGLVGASEAKQRLRDTPAALCSISNRGERGGSAVAAAVVNALRRPA
ncbi:MAG: precorrin-8X methylmutase [Acidimicrobiales bacterium]